MNVYAALEQASSQTDAEKRKHGEDHLKELKLQPGFLSGLLEVFCSGQADFAVRWLAVIYLKNTIEGTWRGAKMVPEEKSHIRGQLLDIAGQQTDPKLRDQFVLVVAKVAKLDFPRNWPTLFQELGQRITSSSDEQTLQNLLVATHQVLKLCATTKIGPARTNLNELAPTLLGILGQTYVTVVQGNPAVAYPALKAIGTLLYSGPERIYRAEEARSIAKQLPEILKSMLPAWEDPKIGCHIRRMGKIYARIADRRPVEFCKLPSSDQVLKLYYDLILHEATDLQKSEDNPWREFHSIVVIQAASILRSLLDVCAKDVRTLSTSLVPLKLKCRDELDKEDLFQSYDMLNLFYSQATMPLIEVILTHYIVLRESEFEQWKEDPEGFVQEEILSTHEFKLNRSFQLLFFKLLKTFPSVSDQVLDYVLKATRSENVLELDSALQALEFGSFTFSQKIQIQELLIGTLLPRIEANASNDSYRIIRRRVCLMVAEYVPLQSSDELRELIYRMTVEMMFGSNPLNDLPVQLAALQTLKSTVDDLDFEVEGFLPYADAVFHKIFDLLNTGIDSLDIKRYVLEVLCTLVEQLGTQLRVEHIQTILQILPPLWGEHTDNQLVKTIIIQTLRHLVDSAKEKSPLCHDFAIQVLQVSVDPKSTLFGYLVEDALQLWSSLIVNADQPYPVLLALFEPLLELLTVSTENLAEELGILASYIQLQPALMLNNGTLTKIFSLFAQYLPDASVEVAVLILTVIDLVCKLCPAGLVGEAFRDSGLVPLLQEYATAYNGDFVLEIRSSKVFSALSWFSIQDPQLLCHLFTFPNLVLPWIRSIKNLGDPHDKKLQTLGLTRAAGVALDVTQSNAGELINLWTSILDEVQEVNGDAEIYHSPDLYPGESEEDLTPEQKRMRLFEPHDPVHNIETKPLIAGVAQQAGLGWAP